MAEVNREFMPDATLGLVFGQPGVYRRSGLHWWLTTTGGSLSSAFAERS